MLYNMAWQAYSKPSNLYFGEERIMSEEGIQQGDLLGPLYFSLGIRNLMQSCESELSVWYLDDGSLLGTPDQVLDDLDKVLNAADTLGLTVNPSKCEIFFTNGTNEEFVREVTAKFQSKTPGIKELSNDNLTLLGAPLTEAACDEVMEVKLDELRLMGERLAMIDAHDALFLLRNCFAIPKLTYFLRTAPFFKKQEILAKYDEVLRSSLETILNVTLEGDAWVQSSLPASKGGLGIRWASDLALPAFLSSSYGAEAGMSTL